MDSKNEKLVLINLPHDLILNIVQFAILEAQNILILGLVCRHWNTLIFNDNALWQQTFSKRFSYDPIKIGGYSFFKDRYKEQLQLTQTLQTLCKSRHVCGSAPGLREAIEKKDIPLIYALMQSNHKIKINDIDDQVIAQELLRLMSLCVDLPQSLFSQLMRVGFGNEKNEPVCGRPLHVIAGYAEKNLLHKVFRALDNELFELSDWCDLDDDNFIEFLFVFPVKRLHLVLEMLREALGGRKLSNLLVYRKEFDGFSVIHKAAFSQKPLHFAVMCRFLQEEDYIIFLKSAHRCDEIPVFILAKDNDVPSLSLLLSLWGEKASHFLKHQNIEGKTVLHFAIRSCSLPILQLILDAMGDEKLDLLKMKDILGNDILGEALYRYNLETLSVVLQLLDTYNYLDIAKELYACNNFNDNLNKNTMLEESDVHELFKTYGIENRADVKWCTLL